MIEKIREYFLNEVRLVEDFKNILADYLEEDATSYVIEPIPVESVLKQYSDGGSLNQFVFQFGSREYYDSSETQNIENLDFYERFKNELEANNNNGILPDIKGIQSIECLNNGTIQNVQEGTAKYVIQMRITYLRDKDEDRPSL